MGYCIVKWYLKPHLSAFLSGGDYFYQVSTGMVIPMQVFRDVKSDKNVALSAEFKRPRLNTATLDSILAKRRGKDLSAKQVKDIKAIRKSNNVKPLSAAIYWDKQQTRDLYGAYCLTYRLMTERYVAKNTATVKKSRAKHEKLSYEEKDVLRLRANKLQCERNVRKRPA
jgi:hypothetical protein